MNFAPLDDLAGWQRQRALEPPAGSDPALARLGDAGAAVAPALPHPSDRLGPEAEADTPDQAGKGSNSPHT